MKVFVAIDYFVLHEKVTSLSQGAECSVPNFRTQKLKKAVEATARLTVTGDPIFFRKKKKQAESIRVLHPEDIT